MEANKRTVSGAENKWRFYKFLVITETHIKSEMQSQLDETCTILLKENQALFGKIVSFHGKQWLFEFKNTLLQGSFRVSLSFLWLTFQNVFDK